jgi:2-methylcitrate dehydratase
VEIETTDGEVVHGPAAPSPGHPKNPFSDADLAAKLVENVEPFAGPARTQELAKVLFSIEQIKNVRELTALLALDANSGVDSTIAE